jgi:enoyl-CoA hydratase/carnithine racemase
MFGIALQRESGMADEWVCIKEWQDLILDRLEGARVARITLNRPERRNCWNKSMLEACFEALEAIRAEKDVRAVITRGAGPSFSSGLDLNYLRSIQDKEGDWDRPPVNFQLTETVRQFPRIMIAQVHGYCLGGSLAFMNAHDLVIAAEDAQIGMPEMMRGSFGQLATSTLFHAQIPMKKAALIQLTCRNLTGVEADRIGLVSMAVPAPELETTTTDIAREIGLRHMAPLQCAKIAVQMGRDLALPQAINIDRLVGARQSQAVDPTADLDSYLHSQKGGTNVGYKRRDV